MQGLFSGQIGSGFRNNTVFSSVVTDGMGLVHAGGVISGALRCLFGDTVEVTGMYAGGANAVLVSYDSNGNPLRAKTVLSGSNSSSFASLALDGAGCIYASGVISNSGTFTFALGVSVSGTYVVPMLCRVLCQCAGDCYVFKVFAVLPKAVLLLWLMLKGWWLFTCFIGWSGTPGLIPSFRRVSDEREISPSRRKDEGCLVELVPPRHRSPPGDAVDAQDFIPRFIAGDGGEPSVA
jgi:hypothetical protein